MKSIAGAMLDQGGWQAYEGRLLERLWELMDEARDAPADGSSADAFRQGLGELEGLEASDLLVGGTPFFWMNVHRLYGSERRGAQAQMIRDLLMTGFDAYFQALPKGAGVTLSGGERRTLILPKLGVVIPAVLQAHLRRRSSHILEVEADGSRHTLDLSQHSHPWRARTLKISAEGAETVMAVPDAALMASDVNGIFAEGDLRPFAQRVGQALQWIQTIDGELCASIHKLIHWYVPLNMLSPSLHPSYSERDLVGVVHMSEAYEGIRLCESIVHEFHHNELHALQCTQELTRNDPGAVFYSPWRPDPRTLSGLLHALHTFCAVVKFHEAAEAVREIDFDRPGIRQRRAKFCQMLRIGMLQVPAENLTPLGSRILQAIEADVVHQEQVLELGKGTILEAVRAHAHTWRQTNPDYVQNFRWPEGAPAPVG